MRLFLVLLFILSSLFSMDSMQVDGLKSGKFKTAGGAFFEKDCICTHLNVAQRVDNSSKVTVSNICDKKTFDGEIIIANGTLTRSKQPSE